MNLPTTLADLEALIHQHAPIVYLNPNEHYQLSPVEFFLANADLIEIGGSNNPVKTHPLKASDLPTGAENGSKYQLVLKDDSSGVRAGDPDNAKIYVHVRQPDSAHIDLQFWFFYAYNGPGTVFLEYQVTRPDPSIWHPLRTKTEKTNGTALAAPLGEHEGDWEHVILRISLASNELEKVYFSQHSGGIWLDRNQLSNWEDGRLVVFSSDNGHASYPDGNSENLSEQKDWTILGSGVNFGLVNATGYGKRFDAAERFEIMSVGSTLDSIGFTEPAWVNFYGRWGRTKESHLSDAAIEHIGELALGSVATVAFAIPGVSSGIKAAVSHFAKMEEDGPSAPISKTAWNGGEG